MCENCIGLTHIHTGKNKQEAKIAILSKFIGKQQQNNKQKYIGANRPLSHDRHTAEVGNNA